MSKQVVDSTIEVDHVDPAFLPTCKLCRHRMVLAVDVDARLCLRCDDWPERDAVALALGYPGGLPVRTVLR